MLAYFEHLLLVLSSHLPLKVFVLFASFIEELIPPIPSPSVMIIAGSVAVIQNYHVVGLIILVILGVIGKTLGALAVYLIVDKAENLLSPRLAKFFGLSHETIESFGARLGRGPRDYFILIALRAFPFIPSSIISVGCGLLKVRLKLFLVSTVIGSLIRNFIFIYLGYIGFSALNSLVKSSNAIENIIQLLILIVILSGLGYLYYRQKKKNVKISRLG